MQLPKKWRVWLYQRIESEYRTGIFCLAGYFLFPDEIIRSRSIMVEDCRVVTQQVQHRSGNEVLKC
jgi:hypothetical protein